MILESIAAIATLVGAAQPIQPSVPEAGQEQPDDARTAGAQAAVTAFLQDFLLDPEGARVTMTRGPRAGEVRPDVWGTWRGDLVCYSINGRNAYGGFVGVERFLFVIAEGQVVGHLQETRNFRYEMRIEEECALPAD